MDTDQIRKLAMMCAAQISEQTGHAVQIVTCHTDREKSLITPIYVGIGSWYERKGLVQEFIDADKGHSLAHEISEAIQTDPPEEDWQKA